jgi:2-keto-4-pentenoate hydratase/2-oxohepta-3-ene-1,7-dioic acid hydratase in catechol pathway
VKLCTVKSETNGAEAAILADQGIFRIADINKKARTSFPTDLFDFIRVGNIKELEAALAEVRDEAIAQSTADTTVLLPYANPPKVWGFGPNYSRHAKDLNVNVQAEIPDAPGSYMQPINTLIGHGDDIIIPPQSQRVTAEAELGVIIGAECRNITPEEASSVIFGYTAVLDMTAEDMLRKNLRYIARSKGFDTFFSFGPCIVTADEITDVLSINIATIVNGETQAEGPVSNMTYDPAWLVSFQSEMTSLEVGDVIATGTPGASVIKPGDVVEARLSGIGVLRNNVRAAD